MSTTSGGEPPTSSDASRAWYSSSLPGTGTRVTFTPGFWASKPSAAAWNASTSAGSPNIMNRTSPANGALVASESGPAATVGTAALGMAVVSESGPAATVGTTAVAAAVGTNGVDCEHAPNTTLSMSTNGKTGRIDKRFTIFSKHLPIANSAHRNACPLEFQESVCAPARLPLILTALLAWGILPSPRPRHLCTELST